jgi:hypothetical protein
MEELGVEVRFGKDQEDPKLVVCIHESELSEGKEEERGKRRKYRFSFTYRNSHRRNSRPLLYCCRIVLLVALLLFFIFRSNSVTMTTINLDKEYGYVVLVAVGFWVLQFLFMIPIGLLRNKTGIKPPTLYPTDKQITNLKLSPEEVDTYMRAQVTLSHPLLCTCLPSA